MSERLRLALLQISTGPDKEDNLKKVVGIIEDFDESPDIVVTPEYLMALQDGNLTKELVRENAENLGSNFVSVLREKAKEAGIPLLFTTYREDDGYFNTSVFVDESGEILAKYDKIHLFDAFDYRESEIFSLGSEVTVFDWKGVRVGLATCFDLRFPELFRIIMKMGADLVLVPSGFYSGPNKTNQWKSLISARSHENNLFVVGVNQPEPYFVGESMVASPLGYEVGSLGKGEEIGLVEINMGDLAESKRKMPIDKLMKSSFYKNYEPYK